MVAKYQGHPESNYKHLWKIQKIIRVTWNKLHLIVGRYKASFFIAHLATLERLKKYTQVRRVKNQQQNWSQTKWHKCTLLIVCEINCTCQASISFQKSVRDVHSFIIQWAHYCYQVRRKKNVCSLLSQQPLYLVEGGYRRVM